MTGARLRRGAQLDYPIRPGLRKGEIMKAPCMKIVIPDDYQDMVHKLACYSLIDRHDVTRFREPACDLDQLVERLRDADVVVAIRERVNFSRVLLERLPRLKLLALVGRNAGTIDFAACTALGIPVSTGKSNSPDAPAELTIALMVASRRNVALEAERMRRGDWPCTLSHRLRGSTLGIFGLGAIGRLVAAAGHGLGMKVLVWGQQGSAERAKAAGYEVAASKEDFFARSDVLSLHVRLKADTSGIVGPADLARMKPTALVVNTSRAELLAPGALVAALEAGRPGYAAVDVYEEEPVTGGNHPLLKMPNALCVPHLGWAEWDNFELYFGEAFEQIVAFEQGAPMRLANPDVKRRG
jgi:D-3-phosphoglycerate dehydrogenase / 2-oxoglutarate reductase